MFADDDALPTIDALDDRVIAGADFDRFYAATARRALRVAFAHTGSWPDAEDLVQEAYAAAYRNWAKVGGYDDPAAWIDRVVTNRAASRWRRVGREVRALTRTQGRAAPGDRLPEEADPAFWDAVRALPTRQREVVVLFYVADRPVADIARQLRCSEGTVKSHLSRARLALHTTLDDPKEAER